MGRSGRCQYIRGEKNRKCHKTTWKLNLCHKCFQEQRLAEQITTKLPTAEQITTKLPTSEQITTKLPTAEQITTKLPTKKAKKARTSQAQVGKGKTGNLEYVHVFLDDLSDESKVKMEDLLKRADDFFSKFERPSRPAARHRMMPLDKESVLLLRSITTSVIELLQGVYSFEDVFQAIKKPRSRSKSLPLSRRESFIAAYPTKEEVFIPPLHRDDILEGVYSVFVLLTDIDTVDAGSVRIHSHTQKCPRDMSNSGAYDLKRFYASHQLLDNCTMMTGKRGDVVAFDGRLLHQSVKNITSNFRNVISFSLFDGKRHPSYKNAK